MQEWAYRNGYLSEHTRTNRAEANGGTDITLVGRDEEGRITGLTRAGAVTRYGYDGAGQLVAAATTPLGKTGAAATARAQVSEWEYDGGGRLVREYTPAGPRTYTYDTAGQLLSVADADGSRTEYVYDGLGRRSRLIGADGSWTEYAGGETGYLQGTVARTPDGTETARHELWVDALGELASVDGRPVWWDSASGIPSLAGIGDEQVLNLPGGVTGIGEAWIAPGRRAARPTDETDPWAVLGVSVIPEPGTVSGMGAGSGPGVSGGLPAGVSLTGNGGLDVAGLEWLGARAYDPAARGFLSTDPLPPVLGAGWDDNPYAYAGNNPLNATDPTGLRPLTDEDLKAYDASSRGAFAAVGDWMSDNWEYVVGGAAIVGGAALLFVPGRQLVGAGLISFGADVVIQKATTGEVNWAQAGVSGGLGMLGFGAGAMAGKLLTNPAARVAVTNGVEGAVSGAGGYLAQTKDPSLAGLTRATAVGGATSVVPVPAIAGTKLDRLSPTPPPLIKTDFDDPAGNFLNREYTPRYLSEDTVLYRAGVSEKPFGSWWSVDTSTSIEQVRNDKSIMPEWPSGAKSPIDSAFEVRFPAGTPVYEGIVAPQTAAGGTVYLGGTSQVHIMESWKSGKVLNSWRLE